MNFKECKDVLRRGVDRSDYEDAYGVWVNRALKSIQQDFNWIAMRDSKIVTMKSGELIARMPADFKELTNARPPIFMRGADEGDKWLPCDVQRHEELLRRDAALLLPRRLQTLMRRGPDVYLQTDGLNWFFGIIDTLSGDVDFKVSYHRFLPPLVADTDSNYLTDVYEEMVVNKIKAIAFEELNDPIAAEFEKLYELKKTKAQLSDSRRWLAGRRLQMGG